MCRRSRFEAWLESNQSSEAGGQPMQDVLKIISVTPHNEQHGRPMSDDEVSSLRASSPRLDRGDYDALLAYLHRTGRPYRAFYNFPHPDNSLVLQANAKHVTEINIGASTYSCEAAHVAQSLVLFQAPDAPRVQVIGRIQAIWGIPLEGYLRYFLVVRSHKMLSQEEQGLGPYLAYPGFKSQLVDAELSLDFAIIEPHHLITHVAGFPLEAGSYEIPRPTIACTISLYRDKR
ncbi:hypothetical protein GGF50DRAFT_66136 [Schizophyllum commune]